MNLLTQNSSKETLMKAIVVRLFMLSNRGVKYLGQRILWPDEESSVSKKRGHYDMVSETQRRILSVYNEVVKICVKNNLRYFAIGGTYLGAIRHHGFIPWDE